MATKIMVAVDESETANNALLWAATNAYKPGDELDVVIVLPPAAYAVYPVAPVATAAAMAAVTHQWEAQKRHDEAQAADKLKAAVHLALGAGVPKQALHAHALPAAGGASGVAESLVEFARARHVDLVVVGSRGLGSFQRSLMGLMGLGSVSDYLIQQLHIPVLVVRGDKAGPLPEGKQRADVPRTMCLAFDDSPHSEAALAWVASHLVHPQDLLHVVVVSLPVPYPVLDETSATVAALESQQWQQRSEEASRLAARMAAKATAAAAAHGIAPERIITSVLPPKGGASDVGASICAYAQEHQADLLALGSRGLSALRSSLASFIGLGSVSMYCVHNVHCPLIVVKTDGPLPEPDSNGAAAAHQPEATPAAALAPLAEAPAEPAKED